MTLDTTDCEMEQKILADHPEQSENRSLPPCRMLSFFTEQDVLSFMVSCYHLLNSFITLLITDLHFPLCSLFVI